MLAARTPAGALDAYAQVCTRNGRRAARIFETVRRAADDAAEVAEVWETLLRNRRAEARTVVDRVAELGPLRQFSDTARATDALWILNNPAHYDALVLRCGWTEDAFQRWLAGHMRHALLSLPPDA